MTRIRRSKNGRNFARWPGWRPRVASNNKSLVILSITDTSCVQSSPASEDDGNPKFAPFLLFSSLAVNY